MASGSVSPILAFVAGLLSFASPCVLPLVPAFIGHLGGQAVKAEARVVSRWSVVLHGGFFVAGFSLVFVVLGAAASWIGRLLYAYLPVVTKMGGVVIIVFGLHSLGLLKIPLLYRDTRRHYVARPELGYISSALMGFFFGAGWSPCVGPTLGAILTLAMSDATVGRGALLLFVYSLGLGTPFLLLALGLDQATGLLARARRFMRVVNIASGLLLVLLGIMIFDNRLGWLTAWLPQISPGF
jgi:cytochrome c-type biogenesis protein